MLVFTPADEEASYSDTIWGGNYKRDFGLDPGDGATVQNLKHWGVGSCTHCPQLDRDKAHVHERAGARAWIANMA